MPAADSVATEEWDFWILMSCALLAPPGSVWLASAFVMRWAGTASAYWLKAIKSVGQIRFRGYVELVQRPSATSNFANHIAN
jgi:hypothetical protein